MLLDCIRGNQSLKNYMDYMKQHYSAPVDPEGMKMVEKMIIKYVQRRHVGEELISRHEQVCLMRLRFET